MRKLLPILLLLITAAGTYAQAQQVDIRKVMVSGVGLEADHATVIKKLGKPSEDTTIEDNPCIGGKARHLKYPGLEVELHEDMDNGKFFAARVVIDSAQWNVSGVKVGSTLAEVKRKFGRGSTEKGENPGETIQAYTDRDEGQLVFELRNGKIVKIYFQFFSC